MSVTIASGAKPCLLSSVRISGFRDNAQVTNAAVAPTGNPTFFALLMALIANADRFSPESARQVRLSTHYPCTEDRYFNFLRYARE